MLYKKELQEYPLLPFPKVKQGKDYQGKHKYAVAVAVVTLSRCGEVFVADVYRWEKKEPVLRFVSDKKNYLVAKYPIEEWHMRNVRDLITCSSVSESAEAVKLTAKFLGDKWGHHTVMRCIEDYIENYNRRKRWEAADAKEALMKKHWGMYPDLPADLGQYCDNNVFDTNYLFFSKIQPHGKRDCRCSHCGKRFRVPKEAKHNTKAVCPKCGAAATYKAAWIRAELKEKAKICIAANVDQQLLLRWVDVERCYAYPAYEKKYSFGTYAYNLYLKGEKIYLYKLRCGFYSYGYYWWRGKLGDQCTDEAYIYANNLREVFGESYYNVDLQKGLTGKHKSIGFSALLNNLKHEPVAEYLFKMGLPRLASELHKFRYVPDDTNFVDLFGIGKEYIPMFREMNVTMREVQIIKAAKCWVSKEMLMRWRALKLESWKDGDVKEILNRVSFARFLNYIEKQKNIIGQTANSCVALWKDYLHMCAGLRVDISDKSVQTPKNIKVAHDQLLEEYKVVEAQERAKKDMERAAALQKDYAAAINEIYSYRTMADYAKNGLQIVLPVDVADLVREGASLGHCVGRAGYAERTIRGESCIVFIRESTDPDKPFYTMEYDLHDRRIRQLYGKGNKAATPAVRQFAEAYIKAIKVRKTQKEKTA